jgi:hypothetical protein
MCLLFRHLEMNCVGPNPHSPSWPLTGYITDLREFKIVLSPSRVVFNVDLIRFKRVVRAFCVPKQNAGGDGALSPIYNYSTTFSWVILFIYSPGEPVSHLQS